MYTALEMVKFILTALLGATTYVLLSIKSKEELKALNNIRHLILGAIAGYVYFLLYSEYSFPDAVVTFIVGYWAPSFLQALANKMRSVLIDVSSNSTSKAVQKVD